MEEKIDITVALDESGVRLDVLLSHRLSLSRSFAAKIIESGDVMVDGKARRPAFKVKAGMRLYGACKRSDGEGPLLPCEIELTILYEDDWIVVIDKPAGLVVHPGQAMRIVHWCMPSLPGTLTSGMWASLPGRGLFIGWTS